MVSENKTFKNKKIRDRAISFFLVFAFIVSGFYGLSLPMISAQAAHVHSDDCYPGTRHTHGFDCWETDVRREQVSFSYANCQDTKTPTQGTYQCPGRIVTYTSTTYPYFNPGPGYTGPGPGPESERTTSFCPLCQATYGSLYENYSSGSSSDTRTKMEGDRCSTLIHTTTDAEKKYVYRYSFVAQQTKTYQFGTNVVCSDSQIPPRSCVVTVKDMSSGSTVASQTLISNPYNDSTGRSGEKFFSANLTAGKAYELSFEAVYSTIRTYGLYRDVQTYSPNTSYKRSPSLTTYSMYDRWYDKAHSSYYSVNYYPYLDNTYRNVFVAQNIPFNISGGNLGTFSYHIYPNGLLDGAYSNKTTAPSYGQRLASCTVFHQSSCSDSTSCTCYGLNKLVPDLIWRKCDYCDGSGYIGDFVCDGIIKSHSEGGGGWGATGSDGQQYYNPSDLPSDFSGTVSSGYWSHTWYACNKCNTTTYETSSSGGSSSNYEGGVVVGGSSSGGSGYGSGSGGPTVTPTPIPEYDYPQGRNVDEVCGAKYREHCPKCYGKTYLFYDGRFISTGRKRGDISYITDNAGKRHYWYEWRCKGYTSTLYGFWEKKPTCGKQECYYYDSAGNKVSAVCDKTVTNLVVQATNQTINYAEPLPLNLKATATFLNGTTKTVTCGLRDSAHKTFVLDDDDFNKSLSIYFTYGDYHGTAKNKGPKEVAGTIFINGFFQLSVTPNEAIRGSCEVVSAHWQNTSTKTHALTTKAVSLKAIPNPGYYLDHWLMNSDKEVSSEIESNVFKTVNYTFNMPPKHLAITAVFEPITYTVTFDVCANKVVIPDPHPVVFNTAYGDISGLPAPTRRGYTFRGWYDEAPKDGVANGNLIEDTTIHQIPNDITLYAYWTPNQYDINFNTNTGDPITETKTVTFDAEYGDLPIPTKEGFEFVEWVVGTYPVYGKIVGDRFVSNAIVSQPFDHTLVAKWRGEGYYVTLDPGEGTLSQSIYQVHPLEPYGNLPIPTRDMYKFVGWQMDDGNYAEPETIVTRMSTHTLTAVWDYRPTSKMIRYDDEYGLLPDPIKIGYKFLNWWTEKDAANVTYGNTITSSAIVKTARDHTIHAEWEPRSYRIEFDSNGGTACTSITVIHGQHYGELPVPEKEDYAFTGWYFVEFNDNGYGTPIDAGSDIVRFANNNEVQTLYAGWAELESIAPVQVSFRTRTLEHIDPIMVEFNEPYGELPIPAPLSSTSVFQGWTYNYQPIIEESIVSIAYDHTLTAEWTLEVVLDNRFGEPRFGQTITMTYGKYSINVPVPTKEGYTFRGYYTEVRGQGTRYYDENGICIHACDGSVTAKETLYAYWLQNPVITPTEPPVPEVTPKPTSAPVRLRIEADIPTAVITSDDGYNTQTGIPSTERVQIANNASEYHFDGVVREVSGTTKIAIQVKVPYVSIWEDYDTEEIYHEADVYGEKTITVHVPRDYVFWQVDSANVQKLTGLAITSGLVDTGNASFAYDGALKTTKHIDYTLEEHVTDPNLVLDYSNYFDEPVKAISETPGTPLTEEEIIALLTIHAKGIAYEDPTQMNVKSDYLIVDGNVLLSDNVNPRVGDASIDVSTIRPTVIQQLAKDGNRELEIQLNPYTPNGKYMLDGYGEFRNLYTATYFGTGESTLEVDSTPVFVHTPVVSYPTAVTPDNPKATLSQPGCLNEFRTQITIDEFAEFLKMDLSDVLIGQHKEAEGYGNRSYEKSNTDKLMFDCLLVKATTPLYIDLNRDSVIPPNRDEWQNREDDLRFENEAIRFTEEEDGRWYVHKEDQKYEIDIADIPIYVLAIECTVDFEITYGTLAINGITGIDGHDVLLASEQSADYFGQVNANTQYPSHFAYCTIPYDVNYRYITLHWYDAEEDLAQVSDENKTIVTKQGYEGYFYVTQFEGFEGTVKVKPSFSLVDKDGAPIEEDVLVFYSDKKDGRDYNYLLPTEDENLKSFHTKWLNIPIIDKDFDEEAHEKTKAIMNSAELSQTWTLKEAEVLESSLAPHIVFGAIMDARHGAYRLPNNIKVLQRSKIPTSTQFTQEQFLTDYVLRDSVLKSDMEVDYATEGYLKVTMDVCVTFADGTPLIEYGSLPTISMYYTLGEESDGLYFKYNGKPQTGNGIDDDMHVEHIYTN